MFLCIECTPPAARDNFHYSINLSHGACECCGFTKTCLDYHGAGLPFEHDCPLDHPDNADVKAAREKTLLDKLERRWTTAPTIWDLPPAERAAALARNQEVVARNEAAIKMQQRKNELLKRYADSRTPILECLDDFFLGRATAAVTLETLIMMQAPERLIEDFRHDHVEPEK